MGVRVEGLARGEGSRGVRRSKRRNERKEDEGGEREVSGRKGNIDKGKIRKLTEKGK